MSGQIRKEIVKLSILRILKILFIIKGKKKKKFLRYFTT